MENITLCELQHLVCAELDRRNLKQPSIRKNALKRVCEYIQACDEIYLHQTLRLPENKIRFKANYAKYKGNKLSGAENSIISEIYNQLK